MTAAPGDLTAALEQENAELRRQLAEALAQQTATAEVLGVISASAGRLAPVFDAIIANAVRICGGAFGILALREGDGFRGVAVDGVGGEFAQTLSRLRNPPPGTGLDRLQQTARTIQITDCTAEPAYDPVRTLNPEFARVRAALHVPMLKEGTLLGAILIYRDQVMAFDDREIALVESFAAQAVIAMENARLITETREALDRQTATAEILQVINSSPGDLAPVFDAMLEKAHSLCGAVLGGLVTYDGENFRLVAEHGIPSQFAQLLRQPFSPRAPQRRLLSGEPFVHVADMATREPDDPDDPIPRASDEAGFRTMLMVPLRKDADLLGYITAQRKEVRPFTDKQIALLENFAAQAVIAIENARLINETREALEQQTATAEVLQIINSSPGDLTPVFEAMLEKAMRLCEAAYGHLMTFDGEIFQTVAVHGKPHLIEKLHQIGPLPGQPGSLGERLARGESVVHIADAADDDAYRSGSPVRRAVVEAGIRSLLGVGLRKDDALIGIIVIYREELRAFSDKQIVLLQNFAAQAVIAMENARLITATKEALDQQTATAEVLQVINASPGDLAPVFDAMLEKAMRLCEAICGHLYTYDGERFRPAAVRGERRFAEWWKQNGPVRPAPGAGPLGRIMQGEPIVVTDYREDQAYSAIPQFKALVDAGDLRSGICVALRKDDALLGSIHIYRQEVRPFADKQIALLQNFAAQAVIAMENARLITETQEALEQQTATAEVLQVINASPGDLAPVFQAILEKAHTICGAAQGAMFLYDGEIFRAVATRGMPEAFNSRLMQGVRDAPASKPLIAGEALAHIIDLAEIDDPISKAAYEIAGGRTLLSVALRKSDALLGMIVSARREVKPFAQSEIALLQNFAQQAVIAMENARLLTETREALEQQTATSEVLQVINSSPGDLKPVFEAMLDKALHLCEASFGFLLTYDGEGFQSAADRGHPAFAAWVRAQGRIMPEPGTANARIVSGERVIHTADVVNDPDCQGDTAMRRAVVEIGGFRTVLTVALRKDDTLLGVIHVYRQEVRPFTDRQVALLQNFAAQAVIAMENSRLLGETRQRTAELQELLEYQTATSEVLKIISRSPVDLGAVLDFVCDTAARLCQVTLGQIFLLGADGVYRWATGFGLEPAYREIEEKAAIAPGAGTLVGRVALTGTTVQILDGMTDPSYESKDELRFLKCHTLLGVPLLRDGVAIGVICLARRDIQGYSEKQIEVVTTFADQAVIAMENVRLLDELRARTDEIAGWNRDLEARVAEQVDELGRVGRLKRFLAPQLAELIVSQGDEKILESHRREIVVVFCDLRGYTAFTETAEPEEVLDFLREYHGALGPLVAQFEGTLDQFSGDGIMVFFNDPVPCPDPAERAVNMAMAMRETAGTLIAAWRRRGRDLGFGAGIAQGYATLGQIGFAERSGYTAIGTVCNLAARLCGEAKDGQILLSQRVAAGLDGNIALEEIGALSLKGLTQPVVAFNVVEAGAGANRIRLV